MGEDTGRWSLALRWCFALTLVAAALLNDPGSAGAVNTIEVNEICSLPNAARAADTDTAVGGCPAGSGADTINVNGGNHLIDVPLVFSTEVVVNGGGATIDGQGLAANIFQLDGAADVTLRDMTITRASGGAIGNTLVWTGSLLGERLTASNSFSAADLTSFGRAVFRDFSAEASVFGFRFLGAGPYMATNGTISGTGTAVQITTNAVTDFVATTFAENALGFLDNGFGTTTVTASLFSNITDCAGTPPTIDGTSYSVNGCGAATLAPQLGNFLGPLADNGCSFPFGCTSTHALLPGSPALDGAGLCGLAADQRGFGRPFGDACDAGAYEAQFAAPDHAKVRLDVFNAALGLPLNQLGAKLMFSDHLNQPCGDPIVILADDADLDTQLQPITVNGVPDIVKVDSYTFGFPVPFGCEFDAEILSPDGYGTPTSMLNGGVAGDELSAKVHRVIDPTFGIVVDRGTTGFTGPFRFIIDGEIAECPPLAGLPIAGNFEAPDGNGDEVGIFEGFDWLLDTTGEFVAPACEFTATGVPPAGLRFDPPSKKFGSDALPGIVNFTLLDESAGVSFGLRGLPIAGDFDGDGNDDLATWAGDLETGEFQFDLNLTGANCPLAGTSQRIAFGSPFGEPHFFFFPGVGLEECVARAVADLGDNPFNLVVWPPELPIAAGEVGTFQFGLAPGIIVDLSFPLLEEHGRQLARLLQVVPEQPGCSERRIIDVQTPDVLRIPILNGDCTYHASLLGVAPVADRSLTPNSGLGANDTVQFESELLPGGFFGSTFVNEEDRFSAPFRPLDTLDLLFIDDIRTFAHPDGNVDGRVNPVVWHAPMPADGVISITIPDSLPDGRHTLTVTVPLIDGSNHVTSIELSVSRAVPPAAPGAIDNPPPAEDPSPVASAAVPARSTAAPSVAPVSELAHTGRPSTTTVSGGLLAVGLGLTALLWRRPGER